MPPANYFIDTSALFKRYVTESGSDVMASIFAADANRFISAITTVEVVSNLRRLVDVDYVITEEDFGIVRTMFFQDIAESRLELVELSPSLLIKSLEICTAQYVSPLDALQLASALDMVEKPFFVCSDKKLLQLAAGKGLPIIDPMQGFGLLPVQ